MSNTSPAPQSLIKDLKRLAPVWGLVVGASLITILGMKAASRNYLENAVSADHSGCEYAAVLIEQGRNLMPEIRTDAGRIRLENLTTGKESLTDSTLGYLKGDARITKAIDRFEEARVLCLTDGAPDRYLTILYWYAGDEVASLTALGRAELFDGNLPTGQALLRSALEKSPEHTPARLSLARSLAENGRANEAADLIANYENQLATEFGGEIALGTIYYFIGERRQAEEYLEAGLEKSIGDVEAIRKLHHLLSDHLDGNKAGDYFFQLAESSEVKNPSAYHFAAINYSRAQNLEKRELALRRTLDLVPRNPGIIFDLALTVHNLGRKQEAKDLLKRALDLDAGKVSERIKSSGITPGE